MATYGKHLQIPLLLLALSSCTFPKQSAMASCARDYDSLDAIMTSCPLDCELSSIDMDFEIVFDEAASMPTYGCNDGQDPVGGTNPRLVLYQVLRAMAALEFDQPLPWTELSLYDWLTTTIDGFSISDTEGSFCCDDQGRMVLSSELLNVPLPARWDSPHNGVGLCDVVGLIVHEARHTQVGPHTCGESDLTPDEMGAWGAEYHFYVWLAEHSGPGLLSDLQVQCAIAHAQMAQSHFCNP